MTGKVDVRVSYEIIDKQGIVKCVAQNRHNDVDTEDLPRFDQAAGIALDAYGQSLAGSRRGKAQAPAKSR